jgi:hypothetical protein
MSPKPEDVRAADATLEGHARSLNPSMARWAEKWGDSGARTVLIEVTYDVFAENPMATAEDADKLAHTIWERVRNAKVAPSWAGHDGTVQLVLRDRVVNDPLTDIRQLVVALIGASGVIATLEAQRGVIDVQLARLRRPRPGAKAVA